MGPEKARLRGLTATVCFPVGNLAPEGSVVKSKAIDPSLIGEDNVYRHRGPARVFTTEEAAIAAIKQGRIGQGDVGTPMRVLFSIDAAGARYDIAVSRRGVRPKL